MLVTESLASLVASRLRDIPDFPERGVVFKDFTPLLADHDALAAVVEDVVARFRGDVDVVVGIEARGFMIGAATAYALGVGFVFLALWLAASTLLFGTTAVMAWSRAGDVAPVVAAIFGVLLVLGTIMVLAIVPIVAVYPFVQRHFTKGVIFGAIKG